MNRLAALPWMILLILGVFFLGRGLFHFLWFDSGAGVVAGMNLSYPNSADIVFLLGAAGIMQITLGVFYIYFALWARGLVPLALWIDFTRSVLLVVMQYSFKMPANPVPGRYAHIAVMLIAFLALIIYYAVQNSKKKG